jgi:hypothetical protein
MIFKYHCRYLESIWLDSDDKKEKIMSEEGKEMGGKIWWG